MWSTSGFHHRGIRNQSSPKDPSLNLPPGILAPSNRTGGEASTTYEETAFIANRSPLNVVQSDSTWPACENHFFIQGLPRLSIYCKLQSGDLSSMKPYGLDLWCPKSKMMRDTLPTALNMVEWGIPEKILHIAVAQIDDKEILHSNVLGWGSSLKGRRHIWGKCTFSHQFLLAPRPRIWMNLYESMNVWICMNFQNLICETAYCPPFVPPKAKVISELVSKFYLRFWPREGTREKYSF